MNTKTICATILLAAVPGLLTAAAVNPCCEIRPPAKSLYVGSPADGGLVWPKAPEQARIRYDGVLRGERDIGRKESFFARMKLTAAGIAPDYVAVERPFDVHADAAGRRVYVSDGGSNKLTVYEARTKRARVLGTDGPGRLVKPMGLGGDAIGRVYVADQAAKRVVVFGTNGEFVRAIGGATQLLNPVDVAADLQRNRVYVVDAYQHQVVVFDTLGSVVGRIGKKTGDLARKASQTQSGSSHGDPGGDAATAAHGWKYTPEPRDVVENRGGEAGEFRYPSSVALGPDGTVYVTDAMNFRIQSFDSEGKHRLNFGSIGDKGGSFARPKGLAVDSKGHIYVADAAFNNLQIFNRDGKLLMAFGNIGHGNGELWMPLGVSIDMENKIYVADRYNRRIQIYQFLGSELTTAQEKTRYSN